ncbi:3-deoxy-manno-octulosonate cytidylyltransferase [Pusillimonas sp. ANT_WB101]|uniref:3-deoxy-manno-octulosonate cytidylyltransferase n=1 Tax=Pusillimonas sp. ANT_WB101 TaxID=2597356 RepID=UPI0011EEB9AD|nr:3-deoxy-manno-octulosonate cytidylyltransferase [Pusillimonas sp. ANT_WB101]KAA0911370.1 3-deoxy-manno-octulosonate cytidylyltransferase [Pusillimonas sp. ANT_WB101]
MLNVVSPTVAIVIPARYGSTRLPGKPLADILGKPMVQHVYERAMQVPGVTQVVVATDDERVRAAVHAFGGSCVMTSPDHPSGTDRLAEVMEQVEADIYVNLQGDEPLVRPKDIALLVSNMAASSTIQVGTLCHRISASDADNPNNVKLVQAENGDALYFSRAKVPFSRDGDEVPYLKHVGIYAYRREVLAAYGQYSQPMMEHAEKLEQLRLLSAGIRIRAFEVDEAGPGVDTPACLERVRGILGGGVPATKVSDTNNSSSSAALRGTAGWPSLNGVRLVITDVDGVLTDGGIYYDETGECLKRFHVRDGLGIRLLEEGGVRVAVLSGRDSPTLRKRLADLGVSVYKLGVKDKFSACHELMAEVGVIAETTVFVGDDSIDLPAFAACGLSFTVADAPYYVKAKASAVLSLKGGHGALRELADAILSAQGKSHIFDSAEGFGTIMAGAVQ